MSTRRRQVVTRGGLRETLEVTDHGAETEHVVVRYEFEADFADLFEVKRREFGRPDLQFAGTLPPSATTREWLPHLGAWRMYAEEGSVLHPDRDAKWRTGCSLVLGVWCAGRGRGLLRCPGASPRHVAAGRLRLLLGRAVTSEHPDPAGELATTERVTREGFERWLGALPQLRTASTPLQATFQRSVTDLAALRMPGPPGNGHRALLPAAGLPWFMAIFALNHEPGQPGRRQQGPVGVARGAGHPQGRQVGDGTLEGGLQRGDRGPQLRQRREPPLEALAGDPLGARARRPGRGVRWSRPGRGARRRRPAATCCGAAPGRRRRPRPRPAHPLRERDLHARLPLGVPVGVQDRPLLGVHPPRAQVWQPLAGGGRGRQGAGEMQVRPPELARLDLEEVREVGIELVADHDVLGLGAVVGHLERLPQATSRHHLVPAGAHRRCSGSRRVEDLPVRRPGVVAAVLATAEQGRLLPVEPQPPQPEHPDVVGVQALAAGCSRPRRRRRPGNGCRRGP